MTPEDDAISDQRVRFRAMQQLLKDHLATDDTRVKGDDE